MARESQGLQIALIVAVIFTVVLAVATFLVSREYQRAKVIAATNLEEKNTAEETLRTIQDENNRMKEVTGFAITDTRDVVDDGFNTDMQTYAPNFDEVNRNYRKVLQYLFQEVEQKNTALAAEKQRVQELRDSFEEHNKATDRQIQQHSDASKKAAADLAAERKKFNDGLAATLSEVQDLRSKLAQSRQEADDSLAEAQVRFDEVRRDRDRLGLLNEKKTEKIEAMDKTVFEVADGKVRWVDPDSRTVWINLGRGDGLGLLTSFAVYSSQTNDVTEEGKKASIEVQQIIGDHLAEARITDDQIENPIMPGDLIHTPLWTPGQREHFALSDGMDIDDDDKTDLEMVRNLITMNGGMVDYWLDDEGEAHGKMTTGTRYLVMGDPPEIHETERLRGRTATMQEADRIGLRRMTLAELLNKMGYIRQAPVVTFGKGVNRNDFRPKPPEGGPEVSRGVVSPLFQQRKPPPKRSAY